MRGKWKFWAVRSDLTGFCIRRKDGSQFLEGTAAEALEFAARVRQFYEGVDVKRVEARSEGILSQIGDGLPPRKLFSIQRHFNGRDWWVNESELTHPCWLKHLEHAISHCAFRGRTYLCEIRVCDAPGKLTSVVLIDQRNDNPTIKCTPSFSIC